eukprot:3626082-Prorocentrum_lima.AAC.1
MTTVTTAQPPTRPAHTHHSTDTTTRMQQQNTGGQNQRTETLRSSRSQTTMRTLRPQPAQ